MVDAASSGEVVGGVEGGLTGPSTLNDREKAAALEDLIQSFRYEWMKIDGHWLEIDGSAIVSPETQRVLELMIAEVRS
jgi:hypothetical protein